MTKSKNSKKFELTMAVVYFLTAVFLIDFFLTNTRTNGVWEWLFVNVVFFLAGPFILIKLILRDDFGKQYFNLSFKKVNVLRTIGVLLLIVALACPFVLYLDWKQYVSVSRWALGGTDFLLFMDLTLTPLVLFSKEFFFRSFLLRSFVSVWGVCWAIFAQSLMNVVFEGYLSGFAISWQQLVLMFFLGLFFGYIAWLNKSVLVSTLLVWAYTVAIDLFFIYQKVNVFE